MAEEAELLEDPIFQLNLILWLLEPLPAPASTTPVFAREGGYLHAIGQPMIAPPRVRPALIDLVGSAEPSCPDVIIRFRDSAEVLVVECKAGGFGREPSTSRQAVTLLTLSADCTEPLNLAPGEQHPGHLAYLTGAQHAEPALDTLGALRRRLGQAALPAAAAGVLALHQLDEGVIITRVPDEPWPARARRALPGPTLVLRRSSGTDPRPLYLIPYDPSVDQTAPEREFCLGQLLGRSLTAAVGRIGAARVPGRVPLEGASILRDATFGLSDRWRAKRDVAATARLVCDLLARALSPETARLEVRVHGGPPQVDLTVRTAADQELAIGLLLRAEPARAAAAADHEPTLFDDIEETADTS
jgi:hypothetical protein